MYIKNDLPMSLPTYPARRQRAAELDARQNPGHARNSDFFSVGSNTCASTGPAFATPPAILQPDRGLRPPASLGGFLRGHEALQSGGAVLPVGPLKPLRRFPYVEEAG